MVALMFSAFFSAPEYRAKAAVAVTGISLSETTHTLQMSSEGTVVWNRIIYTVQPENAANKNVTIKNSNPEVADVKLGKASNLMITALKSGKTTVTVSTEEGGYSASCEIRVIGIPVNKISFSKYPSIVYVGKASSQKVVVSVAPSNADNKSVTFSSTPKGVISVASDGTVTGLSAGTAKVIATAADGSGVTATSGDITVYDVGIKKKNVLELSISMTRNSWAYTGKAIRPGATFVKVYDGSRQLECGTDFTLEYKNVINAGKKARIRVVGMGAYEGYADIYFTIKPRSVAALKIPTITKKKYTGKAIKPKVVGTYGTKSFRAGTKTFKVTYSKNVKVGTAVIKITGQGNFTGTRTIKFKIVK